VEAVVVRSGQQPVVVNLSLDSPEDAARANAGDGFHA
jgi:hypothetical protein